MKRKFIFFGLLLSVSVATVLFSSCGEENELQQRRNTTDDSTIVVKAISLDTATLILAVDEEYTLKATLPDNAVDKTVTWKSSNSDIVTVSNNGKVTAIAKGKATVTAQAGTETDSCVVTVSIKGTVTYELIKPNVYYHYGDSEMGTSDFSKVFLVNVTYKNAKGEMTTEENVTLPWVKQFEVKAPFTASLTQTLIINPKALENPPDEFPQTYSQNRLFKIFVGSGGREISNDGIVAGGGGTLWKDINSWMGANGVKTGTLTFTEDYFNKNSYLK